MRRGDNGSGEVLVTFHLTHELKAQVKEAATARGLTVAAWWREAAARELKRDARGKK